MPILNISKLPVPSHILQPTLMVLDDWGLISVTGADNKKYLQSQFTADISNLGTNNYYFTAHCNHQGKIISSLILFNHNKLVSYLIRRDLMNSQLGELKKYAAFSQVNITINNEVILGIAGFESGKILSNLFKHLPNSNNTVTNDNNGTTLIYIEQPIERFIIITNSKIGDKLYSKIAQYISISDSNQWLALDIEAGFPIIAEFNSAKFLPQAVNLHNLNAISLQKGCYLGQEIIAKAHYLGKNKLALYHLEGCGINKLHVSDYLELKIGNHWKRTGNILASVTLEDNILWVQAILKNNLTQNAILRISHHENSYLSIVP